MKNFLKTSGGIIAHFFGGLYVWASLMGIMFLSFVSVPSFDTIAHFVLIISIIIPLLFLGYFLIKHPNQKGLYMCGGAMLFGLWFPFYAIEKTSGVNWLALIMASGYLFSLAFVAWFLFQKENQEKNLDNNPEKSSKKNGENKREFDGGDMQIRQYDASHVVQASTSGWWHMVVNFLKKGFLMIAYFILGFVISAILVPLLEFVMIYGFRMFSLFISLFSIVPVLGLWIYSKNKIKTKGFYMIVYLIIMIFAYGIMTIAGVTQESLREGDIFSTIIAIFTMIWGLSFSAAVWLEKEN